MPGVGCLQAYARPPDTRGCCHIENCCPLRVGVDNPLRVGAWPMYCRTMEIGAPPQLDAKQDGDQRTPFQ